VASLPTPGGDGNSWGTMLNDYLLQAHAADGTLVTGVTNTHTGNPNTNLSSGSQPGLVQLAGDLSGTAASPTVAGLQGYYVNSGSPSDGNVLTWSTSASNWYAAAPPISYIGDLDGGNASSIYGGTSALDGGVS
jgi:hypothetical protein